MKELAINPLAMQSSIFTSTKGVVYDRSCVTVLKTSQYGIICDDFQVTVMD